MRLSLGESLERWGLAHNGCSKSAYTGLYPDSHLSESITYTGPNLMATKEK